MHLSFNLHTYSTYELSSNQYRNRTICSSTTKHCSEVSWIYNLVRLRFSGKSANVACPASGTSLASPAKAASGTQRSHHVWSYDVSPQFSSGPGKSGELSVLDLVSQFRDVVLVMCMFSSRKPPGGWHFGKGSIWGRGWKWGDQFTSNLGPRWTGSYHSKEGSKLVRGNERGSQRNEKGKSRKQGDCTIIALTPYSCT